MCVNCLLARFHMPGSVNSSVIAFVPTAKCGFYVRAFYLGTDFKIFALSVVMCFPKILLVYIISGPNIKYRFQVPSSSVCRVIYIVIITSFRKVNVTTLWWLRMT